MKACTTLRGVLLAFTEGNLFEPISLGLFCTHKDKSQVSFLYYFFGLFSN